MPLVSAPAHFTAQRERENGRGKGSGEEKVLENSVSCLSDWESGREDIGEPSSPDALGQMRSRIQGTAQDRGGGQVSSQM